MKILKIEILENYLRMKFLKIKINFQHQKMKKHDDSMWQSKGWHVVIGIACQKWSCMSVDSG